MRRGGAPPPVTRTSGETHDLVDALVRENMNLRERLHVLERQFNQGDTAKTWTDDERLEYHATIWKPTESDQRLLAEAAQQRRHKATVPDAATGDGLSYRDALCMGNTY